jgi:hypothetical protein
MLADFFDSANGLWLRPVNAHPVKTPLNVTTPSHPHF